jgi:adenine-specific DNA methylase
MIPKDCKRLAEVDFPIAMVSKHSAREKSIRHGHPSMLHLWWARRPLAACRAMLLGLLLPDPCDPHCPKDFKAKAAKTLLDVPGWATERMKQQVKSDEGLHKALLTFIGDVANWDVANHPRWIGVARELVKAAHPDETPLVVDPFAGGGSIPLEALRLGCEAFASDLNPVACLILKVILEDLPRHGPELAEELRRVGGDIKRAAEKELAEFYPKDPDGATPIAYLWARTVKCESPNCGAEIPLVRSFWLCNKADRRTVLKHRVVRPKNAPPLVEYEIIEPKNEKEVPEGTISNAKAKCLCCGTVLPTERLRAQLSVRHGDSDVVFDAMGNRIGGTRMLAVVTLNPGIKGRNYRLPTEHDYLAVWKAHKRLKGILDDWERIGKKQFCPVPNEPLNSIRPSPNARGLSAVTRYGLRNFGDLFTERQKMALRTYSQNIATTVKEPETLGIALSKMSDLENAFCTWRATSECVDHLFARQAIAMVWDFAEASPVAGATGSWDSMIERSAEGALSAYTGNAQGQVQIADAAESLLPDQAAAVWFTDPPYYDAIPYADLSDFFFVWLKRVMPDHRLLQDPFDRKNELTPKTQECVWNKAHMYEGRPKDGAFFEQAMAKCFKEGRRILRDDGIASVVFAHQTTEGWEALLGGLIHGGLTVTGSWPIATEMASRVRARDNASLATSVHLVCRPRSNDAPVGDWGEVLRELPKRVGDWMERLQGEGIRGADLVFACIGPALEIFSRYRKVETADGREVKLAEYLVKVWEVVGRTALEQVLGTAEAKARNGAAGVLEEDARLTALFLWTLQATNGQNGSGGESNEEAADESGGDEDEEETAPKGKTKGFSLVFDVVRRFAQPLGIDLPWWEGRVIETKKGVVRLMAVSERAKQLFGEDGAEAVAHQLERDPVQALQQSLFPELDAEPVPRIRSRKKGRIAGASPAELEPQKDRVATTLDRVHAAMLLQAGGQANGLRALIKAEQERGPDFLRLANALSALYPKNSEEKRLLDAMLLAVPR